MGRKPKPMAALNKKQKTLLKTIEDGTKSQAGFAAVGTSDELKALTDAGLIETTQPDELGSIKARIKGGAEAMTSPNGVAAKVDFALAKGIAPSIVKRGGGIKEEIYPFTKMEVGDSFLVPVTDTRQEPWKSLVSTVSSATRRFAENHPTEKVQNRKNQWVPKQVYTKRFVLRRVAAGDKYDNGYVEPSDGARVFRVA